jgi:hypothetical protein
VRKRNRKIKGFTNTLKQSVKRSIRGVGSGGKILTELFRKQPWNLKIEKSEELE